MPEPTEQGYRRLADGRVMRSDHTIVTPPENDAYLALADGRVMRSDGTIISWEQFEDELVDPTAEGYLAVAAVWEQMLRRRHPGISWEVGSGTSWEVEG